MDLEMPVLHDPPCKVLKPRVILFTPQTLRKAPMSTTISDRVNAPIDCPLKMSTIAWTRCIEYRQEYKCLCKEARDRLRTKGEGKEAFEEKLRQIRRPTPAKPKGWTVDRMSRFYVIYDEKGELRHRATNQAEADDYLGLAAKVLALQEENARLWKLLEEDLTRAEDPWADVTKMLGDDDADSYASEEEE